MKYANNDNGRFCPKTKRTLRSGVGLNEILLQKNHGKHYFLQSCRLYNYLINSDIHTYTHTHTYNKTTVEHVYTLTNTKTTRYEHSYAPFLYMCGTAQRLHKAVVD